MSNAPERYLTWRFDDDSNISKLTFTSDSKRTNTGTFVLAKEDHTIGNLIRMQLLRDPKVRFSAYRMPHPLIHDCHIRIETIDSRFTPINAFESALADLQLETETLTRAFDNAVTEAERNSSL